MNAMLILLSVSSFVVAILTLGFQYKHLLGILLALEAITMSLFILIFSVFSLSMSSEASLILITLGACEASLGLSVLVSVIRSWGNDYVSSLSVHKC